MQLAVCLAATLLALTWIAAVAQAAIIDQAHEHKLRAIADIFYLVRDQPLDQALPDAMKRHGTAQMAATLSHEASFTYTKLPLLDDPFFQSLHHARRVRATRISRA